MFVSRISYFVAAFGSLVFVSVNADAQSRISLADLPNAPSETASTSSSALTLPLTDLHVRDLAIESYKPPRTIDRQFIVLNTLEVLAAVADAETTLNCVPSPNCREINPILGPHPSRGKMYALALPVTALGVYVSYYYKRKAPTRGWWKVYPLTFSAVHAFAAVNNLAAAHAN